MVTQSTLSAISGSSLQADAALEAQLARILSTVPPFLRLPKAGTRCPYTQLSRTSLSELITPTLRNGGKPPVQAQCLRAHRHAVRGVWLIPAESLFRHLLGAGTQPTELNQATDRLSVVCDDGHTPASHTIYPPTVGRNVHLN